MLDFQIGTKKIQYERIATKSKKNVTIKIHPDKSVKVLAPNYVDNFDVLDILNSKKTWMLSKFQMIDDITKGTSAREFVSGESFLFKGKLLRLKVIKTAKNESVFNDTTRLICKTIHPKDPKHIRKLLLKWYEDSSKQYLNEKVSILEKKIGDSVNDVHIRNQLRRWGSCTASNELLLNWRIIMAPPSVIDYVIVHELAHLTEKKHSDEFWTSVKSVLPGFEDKKEWLRINGPLLDF